MKKFILLLAGIFASTGIYADTISNTLLKITPMNGFFLDSLLIHPLDIE